METGTSCPHGTAVLSGAAGTSVPDGADPNGGILNGMAVPDGAGTGDSPQTVHAGEVFYESPTDLHIVSRNASETQPAKRSSST